MQTEYIKYISVYLALIWLLTICVTVSDKKRAKKGMRRVPEKTLFLLAVLGGAIPEYITMLIIRHKTKHLRFTVGLPFIILSEAALTFCIFFLK